MIYEVTPQIFNSAVTLIWGVTGIEDEHEFPAEEQPLPPVVSPTAESPGYVVESDPEEDGPVDYPMDGGEDRDDDDGDSSGDDADNEDEDKEDEYKEDEEEEEEHLALADSTIIIPTIELVSLPEGTEPVIPPPSIDITTTGARITVWRQASISFPLEVEVERLLAMPNPPPSPPISLLPPSAVERLARSMAPSAHSSPPPMPSALLPSSVACYSHVRPLPPLPPSLYIPPPVDHRDDIPKSERLPRKRSCLFALGPRDTWVDPAEAVPKIAPMTVGEDSRTRISQRVTMDSQRVNLLMEDRIAHQETVLIVEEEAYASRESWAHMIGLSQAVHYEGQTHREQIVETLRVMRNIRREMGDMQAELLALREQQRRARQPGPGVRVPDHQDASRDTDSHI
ncbi:hypothetical protein Tco_0653238 [Tanacetum coccineum]|uniref:Uncharacterized protein n=1 Tax=Tanacetum coccineum TaxID=301880 RepID=A0ABQ4WZT8_9ASTR